jgi:hypothetical protein
MPVIIKIEENSEFQLKYHEGTQTVDTKESVIGEL